MVKRLKRWILSSGIVTVGLFALAGTWRDPWLWAYALIWSMTAGYAMFFIDEDLLEERFHPPTAGADGVALHFVRAAALSHLVVGALDSGRWHLTPVAPGLRGVALAVMAVTLGMFFRAMHENRFFSSVGTGAERPRPSRGRQRSVQHRAASRVRGPHLGYPVQRPGARFMARGRPRTSHVRHDPAPRAVRGCVPDQEPGGLRGVFRPRQAPVDSGRVVITPFDR